MMGSQSSKSGTKVKKSTFHKRSFQQLSQIQNWATRWSLADEQEFQCPNSNTVLMNGSIKVENQGAGNQQQSQNTNRQVIFNI